MIRARGEVRIERSREQVFDFLADLRNEPQFNSDARDIVKVTAGEIGLNTVYTETVRPLGFFEVRIHEYDRPRLLGFDAKNARADIRVIFRLTSADGATDMTAEIEMAPRGAFRVMTPLLGPMLRRMMSKQRGPKIKHAVESHGASD